jgi:hypothetical protein
VFWTSVNSNANPVALCTRDRIAAIRSAVQNMYFNANWMSRGATEVAVINPKFAWLTFTAGSANWG